MGQIAVSVVLLVVAGLFLVGLDHALDVDPGFSLRHGVIASVNLGYGNYTESEGEAFFRRLKTRAQSLPGVQSVSFAAALPFGESHGHHDAQIDGYEPRPDEHMLFKRNMLDADYLDTITKPDSPSRTDVGAGAAEGVPNAATRVAATSSRCLLCMTFWASRSSADRPPLPGPGTARAPIAFLAPTFTYLAYGNWKRGTHELLSRYSHHSDGTGVSYVSSRRPILDMRPKVNHHEIGPVTTGPHAFNADLHLVDWLDTKEYSWDVVTDGDSRFSRPDPRSRAACLRSRREVPEGHGGCRSQSHIGC